MNSNFNDIWIFEAFVIEFIGQRVLLVNPIGRTNVTLATAKMVQGGGRSTPNTRSKVILS